MWNDGLYFNLSKIGLSTFHLKFLALLNTMKQTQRDNVWYQECKKSMHNFLEDLLGVDTC